MAGSVVYQIEGLKIRHSYLDPGKEIPWHKHSRIVDTFYVIRGPLCVETREPEQRLTLQTGETFRAAVGQPHRVTNPTLERVEFLLLQGMGPYDFQSLAPDSNFAVSD